MAGIEALRRRALLAALAALAACSNPAPRTASSAAAGCSVVRGPVEAATAEARRIDLLLERYAQYGFSGTVLVRQGGRPVLHKGYGWASAETRAANSPSTLFDVASLAKSFTAAAILDLEARGRLSTQDALSKFLPGLPADKSGITLHHLLTHTSGYPLDLADIGVGPDDSGEAFLAKAAAANLKHPPGAQYEYSNLGYGLLAHVVERASGLSWRRYVRKRLLRRAGLTDSFLFGEALPPKARLAQGYLGPSEEEAALQPPTNQPGPSPLIWGKHPLGAVGVIATVADLDGWWCALTRPKLLPPAQRAKLFAVQAANQGYGWNVAQAEGKVTRIHRGGLRGSYQSLIAHYPGRGDLLVYGLNKNVGNALWAGLAWSRVERILEGGTVEPPPALGPTDEAAAARRAGEYRVTTGGKLVFRKVGSTLYFGAEGQDALDPLEYAGRERPPEREAVHRASVELVRALGRGDESVARQAAATTPANFAKLAEQWAKWLTQTGRPTGVELLGSTPGAQGHLRVFLRLRGERSPIMIRLLWDSKSGKLLAWGDDIPLPAYVKLWPQSPAGFVAHDLATGATRYFEFAGDAVTIRSAQGEVLLTGRRAG